MLVGVCSDSLLSFVHFSCCDASEAPWYFLEYSNLSSDEVMVQKALEVPGTRERLKKLPSELIFDSTCTGSGGFELASNAVCNALQQQVPGLEICVPGLYH